MHLLTLLRLGPLNIARVAFYRALKRSGIYQRNLSPGNAIPLRLQLETAFGGPLNPVFAGNDSAVLAEADQLLSGSAQYFLAHTCKVGTPPNWFLNPFEEREHPESTSHWSRIKDFDAAVGDIKVVWEMSRFYWATVFARAWRTSRDSRYLEALQLWMDDWSLRNPEHIGPNWMCGQEASIRLINTALALRIVGLDRVIGSGLSAFIMAHCRRISLTAFYAVGQENNHGTSEAVGLFVGGSWLAEHGTGREKVRGRKWAQKGRALLENRVSRLVLADGSFSQHSLTYHRVLLDTISVAESWRRYVHESPFSDEFYVRATAATRWLKAMIEPTNGDGPNLGANDGAHPFRLDKGSYRDFRPSVQLASLLFTARPAFKNGPWDETAWWLNVAQDTAVSTCPQEMGGTTFRNGGYVILRNAAGARVLLRGSNTRFRPAHADALHVDLWWRGQNILRDAGTYSYADSTASAESLASAAGHNVIQFDDHDQMPRLGRFLYGAWIEVHGDHGITARDDELTWTGCYTDFWGARHQRTVILNGNTLRIVDQIRGYKRKAVLRWRLVPGKWSQDQTGCVSSLGRIKIESSVPICRMSVENGWESRHYLEKTVVPVLEVEIDQEPAQITSTVTLN